MNKLIDLFKTTNGSYTVVNCDNGFVIEMSGENDKEEWINIKWIVMTLEELQDVVKDLARMNKA
jgi:hypothetical protein